MGQLQKIEEELTDLGYRILALSPDRPESLQESISRHQLGYELYSDASMEASRAFGVAYRLSQEQVKAYRDFGVELSASSGEGSYQLPVPAVFLVANGEVVFQYVNADYKIRLQSDLLLAAARHHSE